MSIPFFSLSLVGKRVRHSLLALVASVSLTACSTMLEHLPGVYTLDIQQGNIVDQAMIDQLRPAMNKRQVLYIMGSPMLVDAFHPQRWDYIYSEQPSGEDRQQKKITLFFNNDQISGIQGDFKPSGVSVIKRVPEITVAVPKRNLDHTLWGKLTRMFTLKNEADVSKKPKTDQSSSDTNLPF